jgi:hypothetical protein
MRALPHSYRSVAAETGDIARVHVPGECGGTWHVERTSDGWILVAAADPARVVSTTTIPPEIAWRIFTKGISTADARQRVALEGDRRIASAALNTIAIVG